MSPNPQETADLVTFTEKILNITLFSMLYILRASCKKLVLSFHNLYLVGLKYHLFKFTVESFSMRYPTTLGNGCHGEKFLLIQI